MKIKNNLFTASNLPKLGYLLAFVFILGCGGGGSGGTASSPIASSETGSSGDTASSENSDTDSNTGAGSGDPASSENSDTDSNTGAGSGDTASSENSDTYINTGVGRGITELEGNDPDNGVSKTASIIDTGIRNFDDEVQKVYDLTQTEFELKNIPEFKLELLKDPESEEIYFKLKDPVPANVYHLPHETGKEDILLHLNFSSFLVSFVNNTDFTVKIEPFKYAGGFNFDIATISLSPNGGEEIVEFDNFVYTPLEDIATTRPKSDGRSSIQITGKVEEDTDVKITPFLIKAGPIFQVKISENLASQELVYHSNVGRYTLNGAKLDIYNDIYPTETFHPVFYIANDTNIARKITYDLKSNTVTRIQFYTKYNESFYNQLSWDEEGRRSTTHTFELDPNQGEFFYFGYNSGGLPPEAPIASVKVKIENSNEPADSPVILDILEFFRTYQLYT